MEDDETTDTTAAPTTPATPAAPAPAAGDAALRKQLREAQAEVARLNGEVTRLSPLVGQVQKLQGEIRSGRHKQAARDLATDLQDGALDLIWDKLGVDISAEDPDEAALTTALDGARTKFPFAFKTAAAATGENPKPAAPQTPPAHAGRGGRAATGTRFTCKASDHRNPRWVAENSKAIAEAKAAGTYEELPG